MPLRFGIPTVDHLLELRDSTRRGPSSDSTSFAILGPDGSGKSVLALHLAAQYMADCGEMLTGNDDGRPLVIYVSSDFKHESAERVWVNFGLDRPNRRRIPSEGISAAARRLKRSSKPLKLQPLSPGASRHAHKAIHEFLLEPINQSTVGFLDLVHFTAGDDWSFVNSLLVKLESINTKKQLRHLMIIDSVAGFETFVGKLDAFGIEQTRRARIAQCLRNAGDHCHVVFVVEEPNPNERLPEEYVTDVVIRLRSRGEGMRTWRTLEVEKARARNHALGEHVFEIRDKRGSSTAAWENADQPSIDVGAYVHVFHSLSHRSRQTAGDRGLRKLQSSGDVCPFGLPYLDAMLGSEKVEGGPPHIEKRTNGLKVGSTTAMIGDTGTGKTILSEKWIAEGFSETIKNVLGLYAFFSSISGGKPPSAPSQAALNNVCEWLGQSIIEPESSSGSVPSTESAFGSRSAIDIEMLTEAWERGEEESKKLLQDLLKGRNSEPIDKILLAHREALDTFLTRPEDSENDNALRSHLRSRPMQYSAFHDRFNKIETKSLDLMIKELFRHPNLRRPGVLLTTSDRTASDIARDCLHEYLKKQIEAYWASLNQEISQKEAALEVAQQVLEEQLFVRRFDMETRPASMLFETIWRNLIAAQYQIHDAFFPTSMFPNAPTCRARKGHRIRVVIDDLSALYSLCPNVSSDPAFLPYLVAALEREGVTTILVHTDSLRPGEKPTDPISQELQSLLKQTILTWHVPCEGRTRIAISPVFAYSQDTQGLVRELEIGPGRAVNVTPRFELYTDLEIGKPRPVSLAVYLHNATPSFKKYMDQEDVLFRELFVPITGSRNGESGRIIWPLNSAEFLTVKDSSTLPVDVKTDHTVVFQVESFWSIGRHLRALSSQTSYLFEKIVDTDKDEMVEDPFGHFRGKPLHCSPDKGGEQTLCRIAYFSNSGYQNRLMGAQDNGEPPRRVPFMWDFSFLILPTGPWEESGQTRVLCKGGNQRPDWWTRFAADARNKEEKNKQQASEVINEILVKDVIKALQKRKEERGIVPWRLFFGAARAVADRTRKANSANRPVFDFASTTSETVNSMILEIWFSEIDLALLNPESCPWMAQWNVEWQKWRQGVSWSTYDPVEKRKHPLRLRELLTSGLESSITIAEAVKGFQGSSNHEKQKAFTKVPLAVVCLYKTWLLLLEVLDFESLADPQSSFESTQPREAAPDALAVRHFYRSACYQQTKARADEDAVQAQWALPLPGAFCVRGDSFLASPNISRSRLLASHTIDLLSSRRANMVRMQMGLGLPVRDILAKSGCEQLRTALRAKIDREGHGLNPAKAYEYVEEGPWRRGATVELTYGELCQIGAQSHSEFKNNPDRIAPRWLFRNAIADYGRLSRVLSKWLARLIQWTVRYKEDRPLNWEGGFKAYDSLSVGNFEELLKYESFLEFAQHCDLLVEELKAAEYWTPQNTH